MQFSQTWQFFGTFFFLLGWTMIFKYIGGLSSSPTGKALWRSSATSSENTIAALDTTTTFQGNYKNRLVQSWQTLNPQEVSAENTHITED